MHELTYRAVDPDTDWGEVKVSCAECGDLPGTFQHRYAGPILSHATRDTATSEQASGDRGTAVVCHGATLHT